MLNVVVEKYNLAFKTLKTSHNPKTQLVAIIDFFVYLENNRLLHLHEKFIPDFLIYLVNIYKNSSPDNINPKYLIISKHILNRAIKNIKDELVISEITSILELINIKLLICFHYLGEIENGLVILNDILTSSAVKESNVSIDNVYSESSKPNKHINALVDPKLFIVHKAFDVLRKINAEIKNINRYTEEFVNILLIERDNFSIIDYCFGTIRTLECNIVKKRDNRAGNPNFDNITDIQSEGIHTIRSSLISSANIVLKKFNIVLPLKSIQINLRYNEAASIYKGTSFGAGAVILIAAQYLNYTNSRIRILISNSTAFTGSIDDFGNLLKIPDDTLKYKIETAFFSCIKNVVVPSGNTNIALLTVESLKLKYPGKDFNIYGISNITEIFGNSNLAVIQKDSLLKHSRTVLKKHSGISYSLLMIFLVVLATFVINSLIPPKIKPFPQMTQQLNMIYTPDRDSLWNYFSSDKTGGDTISFGEIAIGDQLFHKIDLWNNGSDKEPIRLELEGDNKDEFEIIWGLESQQNLAPEYLYPDLRQKLFIKFIPYKEKGEKSARVVFYNRNEPNKRKFLFLKGYAGYYENGYSLKISEGREFIINPKGNVLKNNFTVSFWFKPSCANIVLLSSENENWTQTKFNLNIGVDSCLILEVLNSKMNPYSLNNMKSNKKVDIGEWNYAAISHLNNKTLVVLNDDVIIHETKNNHFLQIEDYFYFGGYHPLRRGNYEIKRNRNEFLISELRFYNQSLNEKELFAKREKKEYPYDNRLICYYDFDESTGKAVWDKTKNDVFGELYGLTEKSLDYPFQNRTDGNVDFDNTKDHYIKIKEKGQVILNKNVFAPKSNFTIQYEMKAGGKLNTEYRVFHDFRHYESYYYRWMYKYGDSIEISYKKPYSGNIKIPPIKKILDTNWHKYTFDYSYENNSGRFFIDGTKLSDYNFGITKFDLTSEVFFIVFGNTWSYDNPRYINEETSIDNIALFDRILDSNEVKISSSVKIKTIKGLLGLWTFSSLRNNLCYDEINNIPIFLWDFFELCTKE